MIGKGRTGTVYLALHKELEEYRAIKAVEKSSVRYEIFRKEALLLKELRHPGIPIVYDIEEDEQYSYLVEEYLQGDSLETLVKSQGPLARCTVLRYVIQICGVVDYLHSAGTEPILHLDLQPKNLLVCHETIKLIDFGQAAGLTQANQALQRFGTVGFAAPEQYDCSLALDERTDIYAIGGLLFFLATGIYPAREACPAALGSKLWSREAGRIMAACMEPVKEARYKSVSQLKKDFEGLSDKTVSSLVVAVSGLEPGIGTTHISLAVSAYLWKKGIPNLYEECCPSGHIRKLLERRKTGMDSFGIFRAFGCALKPYYGKQACFLQHDYPVVIQDWGVWREGGEKVSEPAVCLFVAGGKWWNKSFPENLAEDLLDKTIILYNFSDRRIGLEAPRRARKGSMLKIPLFSNPFFPDRQAGEWLGMLWDMISKKGQAGSLPALGKGAFLKWKVKVPRP